MITLTQFCTQNGIGTLTQVEFSNWLLDNDYDLKERQGKEWWNLWYVFLTRSES